MKKSLKHWESNGWVRSQSTSSGEIGQLFKVVDQAISDTQSSISTDARFRIAYEAALALCTILVRASGYRVERDSHHYRTLQVLPLILGEGYAKDRAFLDDCRKMRNELTYSRIGIASERDTKDLLALVDRLREDVRSWLEAEHAELLPS